MLPMLLLACFPPPTAAVASEDSEEKVESGLVYDACDQGVASPEACRTATTESRNDDYTMKSTIEAESATRESAQHPPTMITVNGERLWVYTDASATRVFREVGRARPRGPYTEVRVGDFTKDGVEDFALMSGKEPRQIWVAKRGGRPENVEQTKFEKK
ncbi:MAG: hypothetical protein AAF602_00190 [Myxococcota bacterium]